MPKILVIEDETSIRENIMEILDLVGHEVVGAEDGEAGLSQAFECEPDMILCDIMMPKLDGHGVLLAIRSDARTLAIPFIFLTAKADRQSMRAGMSLGADDYLTKPFTPSELIESVETRLTRRAEIKGEPEQQLQELRGNLTRMLPHELRTPLCGIINGSELIIMDASSITTEKVIERAEIILQSGIRLQRLIENYLAYAQVELLRLDPRLEGLRRLRIAQPATFIEYLVRQKAQEVDRVADLTLAVSNVESLCIVEGNLRKMLEELADNAFKFSAVGTPVHVAGDMKDDMYQITITNQGRGFTGEQITRIGAYMQFERQLHEQQGVGLGLIIAKRLAELHGGSLDIESVPDKDTTITISLVPG